MIHFAYKLTLITSSFAGGISLLFTCISFFKLPAPTRGKDLFLFAIKGLTEGIWNGIWAFCLTAIPAYLILIFLEKKMILYFQAKKEEQERILREKKKQTPPEETFSSLS